MAALDTEALSKHSECDTMRLIGSKTNFSTIINEMYCTTLIVSLYFFAGEESLLPLFHKSLNVRKWSDARAIYKTRLLADDHQRIGISTVDTQANHRHTAR